MAGKGLTHTNFQRQTVQWVGRRCCAAGYEVGRCCCAAGYDGRASAFALLQRDKATRPYRLGNGINYYRPRMAQRTKSSDSEFQNKPRVHFDTRTERK